MQSDFGNPPKSPFFKGGLAQAQACGYQNPIMHGEWEAFPPFIKGGSGGIFRSGHQANNSWGKPLW
jgi:hypothetical protein